MLFRPFYLLTIADEHNDVMNDWKFHFWLKRCVVILKKNFRVSKETLHDFPRDVNIIAEIENSVC